MQSVPKLELDVAETTQIRQDFQARAQVARRAARLVVPFPSERWDINEVK